MDKVNLETWTEMDAALLLEERKRLPTLDDVYFQIQSITSQFATFSIPISGTSNEFSII